MSLRQTLAAIVILSVLLIGGFVFIVLRAFPALDATAQAAILGAIAGMVGGVAVSSMTSLVSLWTTSRDVENRLKDRVSNHALELTRMDYDLRQKSLDLTGGKRQFLAPVKVYRELYRALLQLHETGAWPDTIHELGLLQIFELGADSKQKDATNEG
jgi:hypothetical protein